VRTSKPLLITLAIVTLALALLLTGCVEPGAKESNSTAPSSSPTGTTSASSPESTQAEPEPAPQESELVTPLDAWWEPQWSADGLVLDVAYTRGRNSLTEVIHVGTSYTPFGDPIAGGEVTYRTGEDIYGREQNVTISSLVGWHGSVKPDSLAAAGTFRYPATGEDENATFTRSLNVTVTCAYDASGRLTGGRGSERYSGQLMASDGTIAYAGMATCTFAVNDGLLVWTERTEKTSYSYHGEPYAETTAVITSESEYLGGGYVKVRETVSTTTIYADGSYRESEMVLVWQRNAAGVPSGRSGSGTVSGADMIHGASVTYEGSIALDYGFDTRLGWIKTGYHEERSADRELPKRLPFDVIYLDDLYLRPVF
jgi:hypothetical protein